MDTFGEFWNLLNRTEDYLRGGDPGHHEAPPANPRLSNAPVFEPEPADRRAALADLASRIEGCTLCPLSRVRTRPVPGMGALDPLVMIVGEAPTVDEDRSGIPFVGAPGHYLDKWLQAIELDRNSNCYVTNTVKCRPPEDRSPQPGEQASCFPYLERQIQLVKPRAILALGRGAARMLLGEENSVPRDISQIRGQLYQYRELPVVVTYNPADVLKNQSLKRPVWDDLKALRHLLTRGDTP